MHICQLFDMSWCSIFEKLKFIMDLLMFFRGKLFGSNEIDVSLFTMFCVT